MGNKGKLFEKISDYYLGEENTETIKKELEKSAEANELFHWIDFFWNKFNPRPGCSASIQHRTQVKIRKIPDAKHFFRLRAVKYAAIILLALGIGGVTYFYSGEKTRLVEAVSGTGEIKEIELSDGSKVWLNARSSITYPENFRGKFRKVNMTGEVYFEVKHDEEHPFIVSSGMIHVKVLGTSFQVKNYANEPRINTYLAKGSIELKLEDLKKTMELIPGDEVIFDKSTLAVTKTNHPYSVFDSWRFGKLSFYNESLFEIARKLERKFGKEIHISDEAIGNLSFTADFEMETLEQILTFFSEVSDVSYKTIGNGYLISKK